LLAGVLFGQGRHEHFIWVDADGTLMQAPKRYRTQSGKLEKVEAFGHVSVRTPTDTAIGERAVYVPDSGIARLAGNVRITRGQNQLNGQEAEVDMKTGIAHLLRGETDRVTGLVVPNDSTNRDVPALSQPNGGATPTRGTSGTGPGTGKPDGSPATAKPAGGHS
jgi:lipopolysaccharide export system protein LptA